MSKYDEMIKGLIIGLDKLADGTEISLFELMSHCGYHPENYEKDGELFTIYGEFCDAVKETDITLDWSKSEEKDVGLPYNIRFFVRKHDDLVDPDLIKKALDKGEGKIEITIERVKEESAKVIISYDEDTLDIDEDTINSMTIEELQDKLDEAECMLSDLEDEEPDEEDEEAHDEWEDRYSMLEDLIDELEDRISELEDSDE